MLVDLLPHLLHQIHYCHHLFVILNLGLFINIRFVILMSPQFFVGSRLFNKSATMAFISITKSSGGLYGLSMICILSIFVFFRIWTNNFSSSITNNRQ